VVFPPAPSGDQRADATVFAAWWSLVLAWHAGHAIAGVSELGTHGDLVRMLHAARSLRRAHAHGMDTREHFPLPPCWERRWEERPAWLRETFPARPLAPHAAVAPPPSSVR
jgi:hypothetical protein